ncbi:hypothetical protein AB1L30_01110 [Bremerella sp. JC817]|uniref:hypothetical protein n=1 Tax=Bremerella sp. JC817 TaxID=3231756 RepID=UPI003458783C
MHDRIFASELARLVLRLGPADHVQGCAACLMRRDGELELGPAGSREELLRIYRRREHTAQRQEIVVPGGQELVAALASATVELVHVVPVHDAAWSGYVFLANSGEWKCLGCVSTPAGEERSRV